MLSDRVNPYFTLPIEFVPETFYGSSALVRRVLETVSGPTPHSIELLGLPGMGKSTLLRYLVHPLGALKPKGAYLEALRDPYRTHRGLLIFVHVEFRYRSEDVPPFAYLIAQVKAQYEGHRERVAEPREDAKPLFLPELQIDVAQDDTGHDAAIVQLHNQIVQITSQILDQEGVAPRFVLLLDDFDLAFVALSFDQTTRLRPLREHVAFILVTERPLHEVNTRAAGSPFFQTLPLVRMGGLSPSEAQHLASDPAARAGRPFPPGDLSLVQQFADAHSYLIIQACSALWEVRELLGLLDSNEPLTEPGQGLLRGRLEYDFARTFQLYWTLLNDLERETLALLVTEPTSPLMQRQYNALASLVERGLVRYTLATGYVLFSELFVGFIAQLPPKKEALPDASRAPQRAPLIQPNPHAEPPDVDMTGLEATLYEFLRQRGRQLSTFDDLWHSVWRDDEANDAQARRRMQVTISRLRIKLQRRSEDIVSVRGQGYRLVELPAG